MQFLPATFAEFAVNADPGQLLTPYDPADAIYTAARMLCADGARGGTRPASSRRSSPTTTPPGTSARCSPGPSGTQRRPEPAASRPAIAFAEAQIGKPYCWGGQGPACFDCSGLVFAAYAAAASTSPAPLTSGSKTARRYRWSQIQPGDLLFSAGSDGTPANPGHVVMYLGSGQVIQAPQTGEDVQIDPLDLATVVVATGPPTSPPAHDARQPSTGSGREPGEGRGPMTKHAERVSQARPTLVLGRGGGGPARNRPDLHVPSSRHGRDRLVQDRQAPEDPP